MEPGSLDYRTLLAQLHDIIRPEIYAEIGVAFGRSLAISRAKSVGIDPGFTLPAEALANKPWIKLFHMTSDDFFAQYRREHVLDGGALDLSFLDGLHLFEQVLRDFYHLESWSSPGGVIAIHDVLPRAVAWAAREPLPGEWTGDVWRIVPCLQRYRPDLMLRLVDAPPSGVLLVSRLDPANTVLADHETHIRHQFLRQPVPYEVQVRDYLERAAVISPDEWHREVRTEFAQDFRDRGRVTP